MYRCMYMDTYGLCYDDDVIYMKTLKDIEHILNPKHDDLFIDYNHNENLVWENELYDVAREWIKELKEHYKEAYPPADDFLEDIDYWGYHDYAIIDWIKHFFNIEDD